MPNPLDKVIDLIKKTGDNCIILDEKGSPQYVIMGFDKYHNLATNGARLAGLTEDQLINKINGDVASWKKESSSAILDEIESSAPDQDTLGSENQEVLTSLDEENSLNEAKIDEKDEHDGEKYYFEPID